MSEVTIDLEFTRANLDHDHELVRALIQIAVDDLPSLASKLRASLNRNETERVRRLAHAIKGLASNFRAEPLTGLSSQLEIASRAMQNLALKQLVDEVSIACESTVRELNSQLQLDLKQVQPFDEKAARN